MISSFLSVLSLCMDLLDLHVCLSLFTLSKAVQNHLTNTCSPHSLLRLLDAFFLDETKPSEIRAILPFLKDPANRALITGSFLLHVLDPRIPYNDINIIIYSRSDTQLLSVIHSYGRCRSSLQQTFESNPSITMEDNMCEFQGPLGDVPHIRAVILNAQTYLFPQKLRVQLVHIGESPLRLVKTTDFSILRNFWTGKQLFYSNAKAILDRHLDVYAVGSFTGPRTPHTWLSKDWRLMRIAKYRARGFCPSSKDIQKLKEENFLNSILSNPFRLARLRDLRETALNIDADYGLPDKDKYYSYETYMTSRVIKIVELYVCNVYAKKTLKNFTYRVGDHYTIDKLMNYIQAIRPNESVVCDEDDRHVTITNIILFKKCVHEYVLKLDVCYCLDWLLSMIEM